jgi:hypothetical protein
MKPDKPPRRKYRILAMERLMGGGYVVLEPSRGPLLFAGKRKACARFIAKHIARKPKDATSAVSDLVKAMHRPHRMAEDAAS